MKRIGILVMLACLAGGAHAAETAQMINAPAGRMAIGTESGTTWTGNDADHPLYCATPSGGSGGTVDLTKVNGATVSTSNPVPAKITDGTNVLGTSDHPLITDWPADFSALPVIPEWNADTMKATTRSTIANSQANSALTTGCTGSCVRCQVCNIGTTNPICVKTVSGSTGPILYARAAATSPPMCYAFRTVTNIYADSNSTGCTGGSDVEITCEDD